MLIRATNIGKARAHYAMLHCGRMHCAVLLLATCFASSTTSAQVRNCGGVFTDRPCNAASSDKTGSSEPAITIRPTSKPSAEEVRSIIEAKSAIQTLIHNLRTKRFNAQRRYNIRVDISQAEAACGRRETNLDRCRQIVQQLDKQLDEQIAIHTKPEATPTSTPLPPKAKKTPETKKVTESAQTTVIQENNSVVVIQQQTRPRSTPWFVIESSPLYRSHGSSTSRSPRHTREGKASGDRVERQRPPPQQGPPLRMDPPVGSPNRSVIIDNTKQ